MYLYYLSKITPVIWLMAGAFIIGGIVTMFRGRPDGAIPVLVGISMLVSQHYINRENKRSDVDPRDTI